MREIKIYKSTRKAVRLISLCSIFVFIGIWGLVSSSMPSLEAWLCIGFFGLGYPVGIFHLLDKRPQIIINEVGIFDHTTLKEFINWEIIQDAYLIDIYKQKFICLVVDEKFKPSNKKSKLYKSLAKFNEKIGAQELNIALGQIDVDEIRFIDFVNAMIHSEKNEKNILIDQGI